MKSVVVVLANFFGAFQNAHGFEQQVVKVEGVRLAQLFAVLLENVGHAFGFGIGRLQIDLLRVEHVILRPGDSSLDDARRELLVVEAEPPHDALDHRQLIGFVVDDEILGVAGRLSAGSSRRDLQRFDVTSQQAHAKRMEGRNDRLGNRIAADQLVHALRHLGRGFVRERDCKNRLRHRTLVLDQMGDAVRDDARLAAARAREDQQRAFGGFDGFTLLRV